MRNLVALPPSRSDLMKQHIVNTTHSPKAALKSVPLSAVRWTRGFWAEHIEQAREVTARCLWDLLVDPAAGHVLDNFRLAAGLQEGERRGSWWQDAWLYKWIEAAACLFSITGDAWLDDRMDEGIALIAAAQEEDGYVGTQTRATGAPRFEDIRRHEVYTMGHLLTAAVIHRRITGKTTFLDIAVRVGDFLCGVLGVSAEPCFAHNPSAIMGLVELYRETGEERYLRCAELIVDARGTKPQPRRGDLWHRPTGLEGTDQIQDRVPLRQSRDVVGHNVFFTYLFAGAADVYLETGDPTLRESLERLWEDLVHRKINVNGGVSPMGTGLSLHQDVVVEAVGKPYFLPNADSYNETCGQVGNLMWNQRMLYAAPRARYADMVEWEMYNGILPGMDLAGENFWYRNQLRRDLGHVVSGHNDLEAREKPGERRICCPTNLLRTVVEFQSYACAVGNDEAWLHQYGAGTASLELLGGDALVLEMDTDYPWEGEIHITVTHAPTRPIVLQLRIPEWATGTAIRINEEEAETLCEPGTYARLERTWNVGDRIRLLLPMPTRLLQAHPEVEQCRNQVAVVRGPVLYCLESVDLPDGVRLPDVLLPSDIGLTPLAAEDMPFGTRVLEGTAFHLPRKEWRDELYRPVSSPRLLSIPIRLIPYFAWANRGPCAMSVWLPVVWRDSSPTA